MAPKLNSGLFGGSFNPVHIGHLRAAEEVMEILSLDKIVFIPSSIHPIKKDKNIIEAKYRLRMLELATKDNKEFEVSYVEMKRPGASYTIDTLKHFKKNYKNDQSYFILGTENFASIDTWKDYKELFNYTNFAILSRPGFNYNNIKDIIPGSLAKQFKFSENKNGMTIYEHLSGNKLIFFKIKGIRISSTAIRRLVKNNKSIKYFVPNNLNNYILKNNLYSGD
jgi:nicotinate-nucleotide adenylyltransferase